MTACKDSKLIEISKDGLKLRRVGNAALPAKTGGVKKRDAKASSKANQEAKEEVKGEEPATPLERDEKGRLVFC